MFKVTIEHYAAACLPGSILNQDHQPEFKCFKNNRHWHHGLSDISKLL